MKIVKADAKGRVTGADPNEKYKQEAFQDGTILLTPVKPYLEEAECIGVINAYELFGAMGVDAMSVLLGDITVAELTSEQRRKAKPHMPESDYPWNGLYFRVFELDDNGNPIKTGDLDKDTRWVCIGLGTNAP